MGRINVRLSDELERKLRQDCQQEGYDNLSDYVRVLLGGENKSENSSLERVTIEAEIDELRRSINILNDNMVSLYKHLLKQMAICTELSVGVLDVAHDDIEEKRNIYNEAVSKAEKLVKSVFK